MEPTLLIRDMEDRLRCHIELAMLALTVPVIEMHLNLALFYREQIAAIGALN
jgi:hypothetical protein